MNEVEKMYRNAGVKYYKEICAIKNVIDKISNQECYFEVSCTSCPLNKTSFTAEKQLFLFQWVCKKFEEIYISYTDFEEVKSWEIVYKISVHRNSFEECLCAFINLLWQSLTEEERKQIKEILE